MLLISFLFFLFLVLPFSYSFSPSLYPVSFTSRSLKSSGASHLLYCHPFLNASSPSSVNFTSDRFGFLSISLFLSSSFSVLSCELPELPYANQDRSVSL
jgi:hypothetical protein